MLQVNVPKLNQTFKKSETTETVAISLVNLIRDIFSILVQKHDHACVLIAEVSHPITGQNFLKDEHSSGLTDQKT